MAKLEEKAIRELNIDLKNRLYDILSKTEMQNVITKLSSKMNKNEMSKLMCDPDYFTMDDLFNSLEKTNKIYLTKLLDEPKKEKDMAAPIISRLRRNKFKASREVPLPKEGKGKPRKIDVAGYKKSFLGGISVIGFELKSEISRGAIDKALSQARQYQDYCEQVYVCFSPLLYATYFDQINSAIKKEKRMGAWVVGTKQVYLELQEAYANQIYDEQQQTMVKFIDSGKTS